MTSDGGSMASLADFEWASACQYISYVSRVAGLVEIPADAISSMGVARRGIKEAKEKKKKTLAMLAKNMRLVVVFVQGQEAPLSPLEKAIIRSMYVSLSSAQNTVIAHLARLELLALSVQSAFAEEAPDDFPF